MPKIEIEISAKTAHLLLPDHEFFERDQQVFQRPIRPWYPPSWLDEAGNPLPDVHKVTPGEWPPCKPGDAIERLTRQERERRVYNSWRGSAEWLAGLCSIVAIRIIRRAGQ